MWIMDEKQGNWHFIGDYFGILMDERVTGFPFNVCENPMYVGSTLNFLATALW